MTKHVDEQYYEQVIEALQPFLFEEYNDETSAAMIEVLSFLPDPPVRTTFSEEDNTVAFFSVSGEQVVFIGVSHVA